jgi:hypothetical protein
MRKFICLLAMLVAIQSAGLAQNATVSAKETKATEEIRSVLASKLNLSADVVEKVIPIEKEFHASLASIQTMNGLNLKAREKKISAAHVTRRAKLMEIPLTGRQMEDVTELVESIRRKHKL